MKEIKHIFFDLDHTLWDYDYNSRKVLEDMYITFGLSEVINATSEGFISTFYRVNAMLWRRYNADEITRDQIRSGRFVQVLQHCSGVDVNGLADKLRDYFMYHCPRQPKTMEDADMVLNYLKKRYDLSIITNGFDDVQFVKLKFCGLDKYFSHVITSETAGFKKPDPQIFQYALSRTGLNHSQVLMIGDNPKTDIRGARSAGITPLLFNPQRKSISDCELQITHLGELIKML